GGMAQRDTGGADAVAELAWTAAGVELVRALSAHEGIERARRIHRSRRTREQFCRPKDRGAVGATDLHAELRVRRGRREEDVEHASAGQVAAPAIADASQAAHTPFQTGHIGFLLRGVPDLGRVLGPVIEGLVTLTADDRIFGKELDLVVD